MPAHDLADIKAKASAALAASEPLVEWNHDNSAAIVSDLLDFTFDQAMRFILEEIADRLDPSCFCETKGYGGGADVYRHDARGREWYVKLSVTRDAGARLVVMSFHPPTKPLRLARVRVRL